MLHLCARPGPSALRAILCLSPLCPAPPIWDVCPCSLCFPGFSISCLPAGFGWWGAWLWGSRGAEKGEAWELSPSLNALDIIPHKNCLSDVSRTHLSCQDSHCLLWPWSWTQVTLWPFSLRKVVTPSTCQSHAGPPCQVLLLSFYHLHKELNTLYFISPWTFGHQRLVSWKTIFPWTTGWRIVSGWFKLTTCFVAHFLTDPDQYQFVAWKLGTSALFYIPRLVCFPDWALTDIIMAFLYHSEIFSYIYIILDIRFW